MIRISHWTNAVLASLHTKLVAEAAEGRFRYPTLSQRGLEDEMERFIRATHQRGSAPTAATPAPSSAPPEGGPAPLPACSPPKQAVDKASDECPLLTEFLERRARS